MKQQPGKPDEQLLLLEIEPLLLVLGGEGGAGVDESLRQRRAGAASDTFANGFDDVGASATGAICAGRRALTMRRVFSFSADARWNVPACSSGLKARGSSSARSCAS